MTKHFKSRKGYDKYTAYIHMHHIKTNKKKKYVYIDNKKHKINHKKW